jgi:SAM-dependent methyltransferase
VERLLAVEANVEEYRRQLVTNGAPHLSHRSVSQRFETHVNSIASAYSRQFSVLDVGGGSGEATRAWTKHNSVITVVDTSAVLLERLGRVVPGATAIRADAIEFASRTEERFDVVAHVAMLHHVPDYAALLRASIRLVRPGGFLMTFQDPLQYSTLPRGSLYASMGAFYAWRLGEGNYRQGIATTIRRLRGVYDPTKRSDFAEYHVVRNGVDLDSIVRGLQPAFLSVEIDRYWSTQSRLGQWLGDKLGLESSFGVIASGRFDRQTQEESPSADHRPPAKAP